jgi:hypothetical protein
MNFRDYLDMLAKNEEAQDKAEVTIDVTAREWDFANEDDDDDPYACLEGL